MPFHPISGELPHLERSGFCMEELANDGDWLKMGSCFLLALGSGWEVSGLILDGSSDS